MMLEQKTSNLPMGLRWLCTLAAAVAVTGTLLPSATAEPSRRGLRTAASGLADMGVVGGAADAIDVEHAATTLHSAEVNSLANQGLMQTAGVLSPLCWECTLIH